MNLSIDTLHSSGFVADADDNGSAFCIGVSADDVRELGRFLFFLLAARQSKSTCFAPARCVGFGMGIQGAVGFPIDFFGLKIKLLPLPGEGAELFDSQLAKLIIFIESASMPPFFFLNHTDDITLAGHCRRGVVRFLTQKMKQLFKLLIV